MVPKLPLLKCSRTEHTQLQEVLSQQLDVKRLACLRQLQHKYDHGMTAV